MYDDMEEVMLLLGNLRRGFYCENYTYYSS